jgi:hypothetical protein
MPFVKRQGFNNDMTFEYTEKQRQTLYNLADNDNLRAVLRNETRGSVLNHNFVYFSKTDNGHQALSILLQAEQINSNVIQLEYALKRKDFTAIARVLQQEGHTCEAGDTHVSYLFQKYPRKEII